MARRLKRLGQTTSEYGIADADHQEILCKKCYRGKAGPREESWGHGIDRGEVDTPQHCYQCGVLMPNTLTSYGVEYVQNRLDNDMGDPKVLALWKRVFAYELAA